MPCQTVGFSRICFLYLGLISIFKFSSVTATKTKCPIDLKFAVMVFKTKQQELRGKVNVSKSPNSSKYPGKLDYQASFAKKQVEMQIAGMKIKFTMWYSTFFWSLFVIQAICSPASGSELLIWQLWPKCPYLSLFSSSSQRKLSKICGTAIKN